MSYKKVSLSYILDLVTVGKDYQNPPNDIIFGGRDISPRHATIHQIEGKCILKSLKP